MVTHRSVMRIQKRAPSLVAQRRRQLSRSDDVGEEHRGQDAVDFNNGTVSSQELANFLDGRLRSKREGVARSQLDKPGIGDVVGNISAMCIRNLQVFSAV